MLQNTYIPIQCVNVITGFKGAKKEKPKSNFMFEMLNINLLLESMVYWHQINESHL